MFRARDEPSCSGGGGADTYFHLRIGSVFVVLVTSTGGALFPLLAKRSTMINLPGYLFEFAKYFGSGVIIATAFIHLLGPAILALGSPCLSPAWQDYPYALAFVMASAFSLFIIEIIAFRWGTVRLARLGIMQECDTTENHHHVHDEKRDEETASVPKTGPDSTSAQIISLAVLEFGILLHSVFIGMTLAVNENFIILFIVIIFHQTFEGLGIGARLALLKVDEKHTWVLVLAAVLYGITTPVGIAAGLGIRTTYNPGTPTASIVSGTMDSISAGFLIYASLVELMAHEFLFNKEIMNSSNSRLAWILGSMSVGTGLMALLAKWL